MRLAIVFDPGRRVGIGERCTSIIRGMAGITADTFSVQEARMLKAGSHDAYLRLDDGDYSQGGLEHLHPLAWWVADTHLKHSYASICRNAGAVDHLFCFQKTGAERLARDLKKPVQWLPAAADANRAAFVPFADRRWDVAFVGTTGKFSLRKVVLEILEERYPNAFIGTAPREELTAIYSQARVAVNYSINNDINMRTFEAMGAGAFLVTNRIIHNGFEEIFGDGQYCAVFDDATTPLMVRLIDNALAVPAASEASARAAFALVNSRHTYADRVAVLLEALRS